MNILITGGSGFIGTNLVEHLSSDSSNVILNFDKHPPRNEKQLEYWEEGDILDYLKLTHIFSEFDPDILIHLAARTDLDGETIGDYFENIEGVENIVRASNSSPSLKKIIFTSSMLVCRLGHIPQSDHDFQPSTPYGESKVEGEKIFRTQIRNDLDWVIIRPTSLWGPWFGPPYRDFFDMLLNRIFLFPGKLEINRSYGFIGNCVRQISFLMNTEEPLLLNRVHYICDFEPINLYDWAQKIKERAKRGRVARVPFFTLYIAALIGDGLKMIGVKKFPLTRFRLNNMTTNSVLTNELLVRHMGSVFYTLEEGIDATLLWLDDQISSSPDT